ncbi:MAG: glycerophosphodiester phosphodiesterase [Tenericutes bacterium]|nr:glycerophosphodiester phosphodiesterase [Mycoplasmatota bacterium]
MFLKILLITLACIIIIFLLVGLYLISPKKPNKKTAMIMEQVKFAHRGIYNNKEKTPENSMKAFKKALDLKYGIEFDIRETKDNEIVIFHDDDLQRMCNDPRSVNELTLQELKELTLLDSNEKIPTLEEVLKLINGEVPLLVEYKAGLPGCECEELCVLARPILEKYSGKYIIESFNPDVLHWYKKHQPSILRGQLSMGIQCYVVALGKERAKQFSKKKRFMLTHLLYNYIGRPHFISYRWQDIKFAVKLNKLFGAKIACWTVVEKSASEKLLNEYDSIIFENHLA